MLPLSDMMIMFLIITLGYMLGSIKIKGLSLGSSGVLIVALVFGHFGYAVPGVLRNLGLIAFVTAVGLIAGPVFFRNFKKKAFAYILIGILVILLGIVATVISLKLLDIPTPLAIGMFAGALTSTPGLAAAIEATGSDLASVGYGIAYPFGVLGVVLFVQLLPKLTHADMAAEVAKISLPPVEAEGGEEKKKKPLIILEHSGFLTISLAIILGLVVADITIPLPGGGSFSLGTSGGPLLVGLLFGHFGKIGPIALNAPKSTLEVMREFGLVVFLMGAGINAGAGFVDVLKEHGVGLFLAGAFITLLPMIVCYIIARRWLKLDLLNNLGAICGGMTSTPALGSLITVSGTDNVAASYAATYPVALIFVVLGAQFMALLF